MQHIALFFVYFVREPHVVRPSYDFDLRLHRETRTNVGMDGYFPLVIRYVGEMLASVIFTNKQDSHEKESCGFDDWPNL